MNEKLVKQLQEALFKFLVENNALFWYLSFAKPISEHQRFDNSIYGDDFTCWVQPVKTEEDDNKWERLYQQWSPIREEIIYKYECRID